ncbi:MAG: PLDc N-terminal domain-containing protein [Bacteroidales bacterium]|nr:PLDc N-terminal domain-containing protein [Bacteroidales bacterium]
MTFLAIGTWQLSTILIVAFLLLLFPLMALISVLKNDFKGNDKIIWVLLIIFLPFLGALLYFLVGRGRKLKK